MRAHSAKRLIVFLYKKNCLRGGYFTRCCIAEIQQKFYAKNTLCRDVTHALSQQQYLPLFVFCRSHFWSADFFARHFTSAQQFILIALVVFMHAKVVDAKPNKNRLTVSVPKSLFFCFNLWVCAIKIIGVLKESCKVYYRSCSGSPSALKTFTSD